MKGPVVAGGLVLALLLGFVIARSTAAEPSPPPAAGPAAVPSHAHGGAEGGADLGGLSLSASGFTLVPSPANWTAATPQQLSFRILGPDSKPVTRFVLNHEKMLHLIVARHDLTGFQHLHPAMAEDGTWTTPLTLPSPGLWRFYADFVSFDPSGAQARATLAVDTVVPGDFRAVPLPPPTRTADVAGLTVAMEGTPAVNATQPLSFRVLSAGAPVVDLERYLGAYGHLVILREGDLGYLHVHPEEQLVGGAVKFWASAPSVGRYRLFFEFQRAGTVHRTELTLTV